MQSSDRVNAEPEDEVVTTEQINKALSLCNSRNVDDRKFAASVFAKAAPQGLF